MRGLVASHIERIDKTFGDFFLLQNLKPTSPHSNQKSSKTFDYVFLYQKGYLE
jgi:hypothetical protein